MVLVSTCLLYMVMVSVCMVAGHGVGVELTNVKLSSFPSRYISASCVEGELTELKEMV